LIVSVVDITDHLTKRIILSKTGLQDEALTQQVIAAALEVHKQLGPGLLESAYETCLAHELSLRKISFEKQKRLPVVYKGVALDCGYRMDLVVENRVVIELKCVEKLLPVHETQLLTYLRLANLPVGLLFNFYSARLMDGFRRMVL
jgi:GxxExxY protein